MLGQFPQYRQEKYLEQPELREPRYMKHKAGPGVLNPYKERLATWLKADSLRGKRERRSDFALF